MVDSRLRSLFSQLEKQILLARTEGVSAKASLFIARCIRWVVSDV